MRHQVYGFRATLWEEHFGTWKPCMEKPESPECVREVQNLSRVNWEHYVQPEVVKLPGHIMPYPIKVGESDALICACTCDCWALLKQAQA